MSWELRIATIDQQLCNHFHKEQPILAGVPSKIYVIGWRNFALDLPCKTLDTHCIVTLANILRRGGSGGWRLISRIQMQLAFINLYSYDF